MPGSTRIVRGCSSVKDALPAVVALLAVVAAAAAGAAGWESDPTPRESPATVLAAPAPAADKPVTRTRSEVEALIAKAGQTPPDWWDSVPLVCPATVDLTWTVTPGPWNPQKNLGAYIWSIINENPSKWREGVKLLHHVLTVNKDNPARLSETRVALGRAYRNLLEDYARAAYWWRKAGSGNHLHLAHCYWKLGCKAMASEVLRAHENDQPPGDAAIKLWSDMGDLSRALALAGRRAKGPFPDVALVAAGDACRLAGKYSQAKAFYQQTVDLKKGSRGLKNTQKRAAASLAAIDAFDAADPKRVPDGVYQNESLAYAGPLRVEVRVQAGRIESVKVVQHQEKQYFAALTETPRQIERKQSVRGIDAVTGATITSEAIINATAKALAAAAK